MAINKIFVASAALGLAAIGLLNHGGHPMDIHMDDEPGARVPQNPLTSSTTVLAASAILGSVAAGLSWSELCHQRYLRDQENKPKK